MLTHVAKLFSNGIENGPRHTYFQTARHNATSYRPIALLSSLGKLYDHCILERLKTHMERGNHIRQEQFGFRPGHSAVQQAFSVAHLLHTANDAILVAVDMEKAFDKVQHWPTNSTSYTSHSTC